METYWTRSDLTDLEKAVLRYYQDLGNKQHVWSCSIPQSVYHPDCYVINSNLRDPEFSEMLSDEDLEILACFVSKLDSAIEKSPLLESLRLFKGLDNADWIRDKKAGETYTDEGYGSFSTSFEHALSYAALQSDNVRVFLVCRTAPGSRGFYLGLEEEEILLPRSMHYTIDAVMQYPSGKLLPDSEAIVYYVSET